MAYRRTRPVYVWIGAIPILLLAAPAWRRTHYLELVRTVDQTREVQVTVQDLLVSLTEAETGRRGYILTGDAKYLAAVEDTSAKVSSIVRRLSELTSSNPTQQANITTLEHIANERLALLEHTALLGRAGQDAAVKDLEMQSGLAESAQLREIAARVMAEEGRLLDLQKRASSLAYQEANIFLIVGCIGTILLLLLAYRIMRQYAAERDLAESEVLRMNQHLQEKVEQLDQFNRELEQRVKERTAGLERSNSDLQQFASFASHDLQEPLRMVVSYLELLGKTCQGKLGVEAERYIGFAAEGAARMRALIKDLLAYAAGTKEPVLTRMPLSDAVVQARYNLLESIGETGAEITFGHLPDMELDPVKMTLVFQNLLSNAIKFRHPGRAPRISIAARREGANWHVSVCDDGIGFEPKYSERIFVAFQRLHGSGKYPGSGIGLAICKRIIEGHGGRIWAESVPGEGATFHFILPAIDSPPAEESRASFSGAEHGDTESRR
jgi:signal transduction histidine kinase